MPDSIKRPDYQIVEQHLRRIFRKNGGMSGNPFRILPEITVGEYGVGPRGFQRPGVWQLIFKPDAADIDQYTDDWPYPDRFVEVGDIEQMHLDLALLLVSEFDQLTDEEVGLPPALRDFYGDPEG